MFIKCLVKDGYSILQVNLSLGTFLALETASLAAASTTALSASVKLGGGVPELGAGDAGAGEEAGLSPLAGAGELAEEEAGAGLLLAEDGAGLPPALGAAFGEPPLFFLFLLLFFLSFFSPSFSSSESDLGFTFFSLRAGLEVALGAAAPLVEVVFAGVTAALDLVVGLLAGPEDALLVGLLVAPTAEVVEVVVALAP